MGSILVCHNDNPKTCLNLFLLILSRDWVTKYAVWICNQISEHLQIVSASDYSAIAHSLHNVLSLLNLTWLHPCLISTSSAVDPSALLLHGSGPPWLALITQLYSSLLRNDLQQWGILRLPTVYCRLTTLDWLCLDWFASEAKSELLYDWRFTASQFILVPSPFRITTRIFFQLNPCNHRPYVTSSLTKRWICLLSRMSSWYSCGTDPTENIFACTVTQPPERTSQRTSLPTVLPFLHLQVFLRWRSVSFSIVASLLCCNLLTDVSFGWTMSAFSGHTTILVILLPCQLLDYISSNGKMIENHQMKGLRRKWPNANRLLLLNFSWLNEEK
jgi:hypothetical protein